jgi:peroxiredoxin family protein
MSMSDVTSESQTVTLEALQERLATLEKRLDGVEESLPEDKVALVVFSGDLDKVLASFVIANGAAALGMEVKMFFTFWGLTVLKKQSSLNDKGVFQKMMALMSPDNSLDLPVSKMNYFGIGAKMLRQMMADKNVDSLEDMIALAKEMGVTMIACEMSRDVMGINDDELVEGLELAGVAAFLSESLTSKTNLFI